MACNAFRTKFHRGAALTAVLGWSQLALVPDVAGQDDAPLGLTGQLDIASLSVDCTDEWEAAGRTESDRLLALRRCCERDIFLCWDAYTPFDRCCEVVGGPEVRLENVTGVHFITYGSRHYAERARVLAAEAARTRWFTTTRALTPGDLDEAFVRAHGGFMRRHARLGGYGIWKPQIILQTLRGLKDGDIVLYLDAGCTLNKQAGSRFQDYLRAAEQSPLGLFTFVSTLGPQLQYTKADLVDRFAPLLKGPEDLDRVLKAPQHITGMIWVHKSDVAIKFMKQWRAVMGSDYRMIDDSPSRGRNISGFVEHRHDQSVFSMMLYANDHRFFIRDESLATPEQKQFVPIQASRLCGARHYLHADREEWRQAGCIERPGFMPRWAREDEAARASDGLPLPSAQ